MSRPTTRSLTSRERRSLVLLFVVSGTFFGTFMAFVAGPRDGAPIWIHVLSGVISGGVFGAAMTVIIARMWRRAGGLSSTREAQRTFRSGRLPADADPRAWNHLLDRQERAARQAKWYVLFLGALSLGYAALALTNALPDLGPSPWVGVVLFAAIAIYGPFEARMKLSRIRVLREQLAARGAVEAS